MKKMIKDWLGIDIIESTIKTLEFGKNKTLKDAENETKLKEVCGIVAGILKYFDLRIRRKYERDSSWTEIREIYEVFPYKNNKDK